MACYTLILVKCVPCGLLRVSRSSSAASYEQEPSASTHWPRCRTRLPPDAAWRTVTQLTRFHVISRQLAAISFQFILGNLFEFLNDVFLIIETRNVEIKQEFSRRYVNHPLEALLWSFPWQHVDLCWFVAEFWIPAFDWTPGALWPWGFSVLSAVQVQCGPLKMKMVSTLTRNFTTESLGYVPITYITLVDDTSRNLTVTFSISA